MTAVMVLVVVAGPARVGPLHWPLRLQPFLVQSTVVLCAVLLSRTSSDGRPPAPPGQACCGAARRGGAVARVPALWRQHLLGMLLVGAGVAVVWWCLRRGWRGTGVGVAAVAAAAFTIGVGALQHAYFTEPPSPERNMPPLARDYLRPLPVARGDVMVVGDTGADLESSPVWARDALTGSAWYLGRQPVQNMYTTISFRAYKDRYCTSTTADLSRLLDELFSTGRRPDPSRRPAGGEHPAAGRADFPDRNLLSAPPGWRVVASTVRTVTLGAPAPGAGSRKAGVTSPGTSVVLRSASDRPPGSRSGTCRLAVAAWCSVPWPGRLNRTDVGRLGDPVDGYLLRRRPCPREPPRNRHGGVRRPDGPSRWRPGGRRSRSA